MAFILGVLSVFALPPFNFLPILFLCFPFLFFLNHQAEPRQDFKIGYAFGAGHFAFGLSWIGNALLLDPLHLGWLYPICLGAAGAFFGLFIAIPFWLANKFHSPKAQILSFAGFLGLSEWFRSFFLTGFPWNLLGYSFSFSENIIQAASIFGSYGLTVFLILATCAPYAYIHTPNKINRLWAIFVPFIILSSLYFYGAYRLAVHTPISASNIKVRIAQPSIPQKMKWNKQALEENFEKYISLSQSEGFEDINLVVWGETASPFPLDADFQHREKISRAVPPKGYLATGSIRYVGETWDTITPYNSMFVINKNADIIAYYDKTHLVPFGEYIPFRSILPKWIKPVTNTITDFGHGDGPQTITIGKNLKLSALICYEIIFPHQITPKDEQADFILNLTNDGWYGESQGPYQHFISTKMRAVEEGITIIRAANSGISGGINQFGQTIASLPLNKRGYLDFYLPQKSKISTPYHNFGNIIPILLSFVNIAIAFFISLKSAEILKK